MKVCIVSKFPPIEGGISAKTYWLAKGCAEAGAEVHIVTNAHEVEDDYRILSCGEDYYLPQGVFIHNVEQDTPWHIPFSPLYLEKLLDKTVKVCTEHQIDLIDSHYLVPYGIAAFLAGKITGIPYIIRHGGSDMAKFWQQGRLKELLRRALEEAIIVVTDSNRKELSWKNLKVVILPTYVPDERCFTPDVGTKGGAIFAYVGKINFHWQHRGLKQIVDFWDSFSNRSSLVFLAQGKGKEDFIRQCNVTKVQFRDFIPPWEMPSFLKKVDYLFYLVRNNPIPDFSNTVVEAVACGAKIITDDLLAFEIYQPFFNVTDSVLSIDSFSIHVTASESGTLLRTHYASYIDNNLELYERIRRGCGTCQYF